ncbi:MAG: hypothetical protein ABI193_07845, partial [Minicystis sp.]
KRAGVGGAPPIGYGHDAMSYSRNAGHMTGVAQVVDVAVAASTLGATMKAIRAQLQVMRAGLTLNSSNLAMGVERASPDLISAVQGHGRVVQFAAEGSEELRYLDYIGAEAMLEART